MKSKDLIQGGFRGRVWLMHHHIKDFYKQTKDGDPLGGFHRVIALHDMENVKWDEIKNEVPVLPRGWYELSHLSTEDRIEFTRDFWISKLPYHQDLQKFLIQFFQTIDDIYIFAVQRKFDDPFEAHLVYSLKKDRGFFKGCPPITESRVTNLKLEFPDLIFPKDYLAFLEIHDGFCKATDCTGILNSEIVKETTGKLQTDISKIEKELTNTIGESINPNSLIPFYESFGMPFFQCFYKDWYPEDEMGNVYYSGNNNTVSDVKRLDPSSEAMAFPTFSDWLIFYLETIS